MLLIAVCSFALLFGERDNRIVALICIGAATLTRLALQPALTRYTGVETGVMTVDAVTLFSSFTDAVTPRGTGVNSRVAARALSESKLWPANANSAFA